MAVQDLVAVCEIRQGPHDQGRADPLPVEVAPQGRAHRIVHDVGVRGVRMEVGERDVAQFRYDDDSLRWTLYWRDRDQRWFEYDRIEPSIELADLLEEVNADPAGIFWG